MSQDWIKLRKDIATDPAVIFIADRLEETEFEVVGRLHHFWSWADTQTTDGFLPGVSARWVDRYVQRDGFVDALVDAEWLHVDAKGIYIPAFDRHMGQSAKVRAEKSERQRRWRERKNAASSPAVDAIVDAPVDATVDAGASTREEKSKSKSSTPPKPPKGGGEYTEEFEAFWSVYPVRKGKADAAKRWAKMTAKDREDAMLDVPRRLSTDRQWLDGYIPHGSTYLNQRGWEDDITERTDERRETEAQRVERHYREKFGAADGGVLGPHDANLRSRVDGPVWD